MTSPFFVYSSKPAENHGLPHHSAHWRLVKMNFIIPPPAYTQPLLISPSKDSFTHSSMQSHLGMIPHVAWGQNAQQDENCLLLSTNTPTASSNMEWCTCDGPSTNRREQRVYWPSWGWMRTAFGFWVESSWSHALVFDQASPLWDFLIPPVVFNGLIPESYISGQVAHGPKFITSWAVVNTKKDYRFKLTTSNRLKLFVKQETFSLLLFAGNTSKYFSTQCFVSWHGLYVRTSCYQQCRPDRFELHHSLSHCVKGYSAFLYRKKKRRRKKNDSYCNAKNNPSKRRNLFRWVQKLF